MTTTPDTPADRLTTVEALEALYGQAVPGALAKEIDHISEHYQAFIEKAPFVIVATSGPEGLDCSPRGDPPGFVRVHDANTVLIPDRRGNNRLDTLRNIVRDGRVSLLFLVPGVGETMRINGTAAISTNTELCESFTIQGKVPRSVIIVTVERIYFQCQKALARSRLWEAEAQIPRSALPSTGTMLQALFSNDNINEDFDGGKYDSGYAEHMKKTIY
ncbi:MAG: pyridoxamine 5'-phosphate oxidase family protein [Gammaproteobacteria bacterium]|nr:pyridoxamine 5'-phosphate oxidase family protein [Gammaproteobacteria bacterium]